MTPGRGRYDVVVVGAGVNGAGVARDAAMRGLRTLLVDKDDVASGTSAWSSRFIHGGLRYLEHGELHLVRESLRERRRLTRMAPHLVRQVPFTLPVYGHSQRGPLTIRAGMQAYDLLALNRRRERHQVLDRAQTLDRFPGLDAAGLRASARYNEGQAELAERLAVETVVSARRFGADVLTHTPVTTLLVEEGRAVGVRIRERTSGVERDVRATVVVNVAGPWVDTLLQATSMTEPSRLVGATKGSHVVVDLFPGAPAEAVYAEARADGRPLFVSPWCGRLLVGTTDTRYDGDLDDVVIDSSEVAYLLGEVNALFPEAGLRSSDVLLTYSGVRPLPYRPAGAEATVPRSHQVIDHARGQPRIENLLSVVGGKLTTHRNLGRQAVDRVYSKLGGGAPPSRTADTPLPGGATTDLDGFAADLASASALHPLTLDRLVRTYGVRAAEILDLAEDEPELARPLAPAGGRDPDLLAAEVAFAIREEFAWSLQDILLRRTMSWVSEQAGLHVHREAAEVAASVAGWNEERVEQEVAAYERHVRRFTPRVLRDAASPFRDPATPVQPGLA